MFEKEAEEYATRECCMTCNNINHFCKEKCECWTFAKKGAEFGYNKAFVEADKNLKAIVTDFNKAKEIIKKFSEFVNNEVEFDPEHPQEHTDLWNELCEQAEYFLRERE